MLRARPEGCPSSWGQRSRGYLCGRPEVVKTRRQLQTNRSLCSLLLSLKANRAPFPVPGRREEGLAESISLRLSVPYEVH